jgi:diguanylate cyclase (GGDEF) domain
MQTMAQRGVVPLPRNYEVFYAAMTGAIPKLAGALMMLGANPTQQEIDEVAVKFFPERAAESFTNKMSGTMGRELSQLGSTLDFEQKSLLAFGGAVETAKKSLMQAATTGTATPEKVIEFMDVVIQALTSRQDQSTRVAQKVSSSSSKIEELQRENERLRLMANTDALSRLYNRRAFDERLAASYDKAEPEKSNAALLVMDIDRFKQINDKYGHPVGDMVIASVAERIRAVVRKGTFVARTGGEEFAILIEPSERDSGDGIVTHDTMAQIAERVRQGVEALALNVPKTALSIGKVTVSIGACHAKEAMSPGELYQKADAALYRAKQGGRNRVVFHQEGDDLIDDHRYMMYKRQ